MSGLVLWGIILIRVLGVGLFISLDPLIAYLINGMLDAVDGPIYKHLIKLPPVKAQLIDKALDLWLYCWAYLLLPSLPSFAMHFLTATFLLRLVGQFCFFATKNRRVLLYFPNFFEVTFLYVLFLERLGSNLTDNLIPLIGLYLGKIAHEYILHHKEITIFDHVLIPGLHLFQKKRRTYRASKR